MRREWQWQHPINKNKLEDNLIKPVETWKVLNKDSNPKRRKLLKIMNLKPNLVPAILKRNLGRKLKLWEEAINYLNKSLKQRKKELLTIMKGNCPQLQTIKRDNWEDNTINLKEITTPFKPTQRTKEKD